LEGKRYIEMSVLEAGPDAIASLDLQRRKAMTLFNSGINGGLTVQARELRMQAYVEGQTSISKEVAGV
jgi:hypothetical protein